MATPSQVRGIVPRGTVAVVIEFDEATKRPKVTPDPFWVHLEDDEEVVWFCAREHKHGAGPCFKVDFDPKDKPFSNHHFEGHHAKTGCATVTPSETKMYKYTVTVDGQPLDPIGGVRP